MSEHYLIKNQAFRFHPFEVAFCGHAQPWKPALIEKLLEQFAPKHSVGYIKQDARSVTMRYAPTGDMTCHQTILENDFVLIDDNKDSDVPKFVCMDSRDDILRAEKFFNHIIAYVAHDRGHGQISSGKQCFDCRDVDGIAGGILDFLGKRIKQIPLYGLVLAGGKSSRMKKDKSLLEYHGRKQTVYCFELLSRFCEQVFVSNRQDQAELIGHKTLPQIHDTFVDIGPLGGILSAMMRTPEAAWLVLACDLPFVNAVAIETLVRNRNPFKLATAYRNADERGQPEPLCAIYEPKARFRFLQFLACGTWCPRVVLAHSDAHLIAQNPAFSLDNVNNPQEYQKAVDFLQQGFIGK